MQSAVKVFLALLSMPLTLTNACILSQCLFLQFQVRYCVRRRTVQSSPLPWPASRRRHRAPTFLRHYPPLKLGENHNTRP
ncbi:hypothetical protein EDD85DRAFT_856027 [Armillaria nabsnona]|nr:hypothetical protein EDD85DRAFT_856027 [Armillaria nabsnona]